MSYCRFTEGDVYAYETDGGVQFWVSSDNKALDRLCNTFNEAYRYAKELRDAHGLDVPSYAIEALKEDALEEAKRISGASDVIDELQAENAKLRAERDYLLMNSNPTATELRRVRRAWKKDRDENAKLRELENIRMSQVRHCEDLDKDNAKLRELVTCMYRNMQGVLDRSTDTVWVDKIATMRDCMDGHMEVMAELGMPPRDYKSRMHELGIEATDA